MWLRYQVQIGTRNLNHAFITGSTNFQASSFKDHAFICDTPKSYAAVL